MSFNLRLENRIMTFTNIPQTLYNPAILKVRYIQIVYMGGNFVIVVLAKIIWIVLYFYYSIQAVFINTKNPARISVRLIYSRYNRIDKARRGDLLPK